jgi:L-cysteine S-thiosulfotransferase
MRNVNYLALALGFILVACDAGPKGSRGFRLPDGDFQRGRTVFLEFKCYQCHSVAEETLPAPTSFSVMVALGGQVRNVQTDGDLVTSIINPSHRLARGYPRELIAQSHMTNFNNVMTVQQMIDLVTFLQTHYKVRTPPQYKVVKLPTPTADP